MSISLGQDSSDPWRLPPSGAMAGPTGSPALHIASIERVAPLDAQIGVFPKKTAPGALQEALFGQPDPALPTGGDPRPMMTYAILDAAKVTNLPELLERSGLEHRCLFKAAAYDEMKNVAPWIVRLEEGNAFTRHLFTRSNANWHLWDREPGIYLRARATLDEMWRHFRKFTRVQDESGTWFYWRFWDRDTLQALASTPSVNAPWIGSLLGHSLFISLSKDGHASLIRATEPPDPTQPVGKIVLGPEIRALLRAQLQRRRQNEDIRAAHAQLALLGHEGLVPDAELGQTRAWLMECGITKRDQLTQAMSCLAMGFPGTPNSWPAAIRLLLSDRAKGPGIRVWHLRKQVLGDHG